LILIPVNIKVSSLCFQSFGRACSFSRGTARLIQKYMSFGCAIRIFDSDHDIREPVGRNIPDNQSAGGDLIILTLNVNHILVHRDNLFDDISLIIGLAERCENVFYLINWTIGVRANFFKSECCLLNCLRILALLLLDDLVIQQMIVVYV
jgi:hypothetical protein